MKTHLNLISLSFRRRQLVRVALRQWIVVWLLATFSGGAAVWVQWQTKNEETQELTVLEREYEPVAQKKRELNSLRQRLAKLQQREKLTLALSQERPVLTLLGFVSQAARGCDGNVNVQEFTLQQRHGSQTDAHDQSLLTLRGVGTDNLSVARFVAELRDAEIFEQVQLKSTGLATVGEKEGWSYVLECTF